MALQASVPGAVNAVRPYQSYGAITFRETTARSRYQGLLTSVKVEAGRNGSATLNYTLSRNRTDATNDRDGVDIPQNPFPDDRVLLHLSSLLQRQCAWFLKEPCGESNLPHVVNQATKMREFLFLF